MESNLQQTINYLLLFLVRDNKEAAQQIAYVKSAEAYPQRPVIIVGEGLEQPLHEPDMGNPEVETLPDGRYVIHTDLVYNTFFFISRAEELLNPQRDEHGRFLAAYSILGQKNRLQIPLIDEYSNLLLKLTGASLPENRLADVCLTHDIDTIAFYRHLRGFVGGWLREGMDVVLDAVDNINDDPAYTFPWLIEQDQQVQGANVIYFVKHTLGRGYDYPQYNLLGRDFLRTAKMLTKSGATLALHSSYYGKLPYIPTKPTPIAYRIHRSHYLRCSIDQMQKIANSGITDDYTMGFADCAGFRLQTTRPVRWINPKTMQLTSLTLHPLTIMDCTLSNANYMHLDEDEAYFVCQRLIEKVKQHNGELVLLWHNSNLGKGSYHKALYSKILKLI